MDNTGILFIGLETDAALSEHLHPEQDLETDAAIDLEEHKRFIVSSQELGSEAVEATFDGESLNDPEEPCDPRCELKKRLEELVEKFPRIANINIGKAHI